MAATAKAAPAASGVIAEKFHQVDGLEVGITQMDAWSNLGLVARLIGYLAPALPQVFKGGKLDVREAKKLADMDVSQFGDALGELFKRLTPAEVRSLATELLANVTIDGTPAVVVMDGRKLVGRLMTLLRILGLVLVTELGPTFAELLAALPEPAAEGGKGTTTPASPSSSPIT